MSTRLFLLPALLLGCAPSAPPAPHAPGVKARATQLPATVDAFIDQKPSDACADEAQRGAEGARALFTAASKLHTWPVHYPSVVSHRLLACGRDCPTEGNDDGLLDDWFMGHLTEDDAPKLHRGELLALAAELDLRPGKPLRFASGSYATVGELLADAAATHAVPPTTLWDGREGTKGAVYGWELQAFCQYLGPVGAIRDGWTVPEAVAAVAAIGPNTHTEAGTHDLEGLALCMAESRGVDLPAEADRVYGEVETVLNRRLDQDLAQAVDGQLYRDDDSFDGCSSDSIACDHLAMLLRQAHFVEWSSLAEPSCTEPYRAALTRFADLTEATRTALDDPDALESTQDPMSALTVLASTHALHAGRRLAWRYGEER